MHLIQNQLSAKRKYLFGLLLLSGLLTLCVAFTTNDNDNFDVARREVLLRRIGHELLIHSGDRTSRVLPVKKISENEYQISFENEFSFQPELLVSTARNWLAKDPLAKDYVVNVLNCDNTTVVYGFAVSKSKKDDVVACLGRKQPKACYVINIKFKSSGLTAFNKVYLLGSLPVLAFVGFVFIRLNKRRNDLSENQLEDTFNLGSILFDSKNKKLIMNEQTNNLTATETRLLRIFASSPNKTIERARLQKEIWEDEGVVVGRSLDMFISKLRKKLELDSNVAVIVVRGKGYKLEINA